MQVTEFSCGSFVVGLICCHALADGLGAAQFINAVGDYARGLPKPRVSPVWARDIIPSPPSLSSAPPVFSRMFQFRHLAVDLSLDGIARVKSQFLQSTGQRCSTFDVTVAKVWQARTRSLRLADPAIASLVRPGALVDVVGGAGAGRDGGTVLASGARVLAVLRGDDRSASAPLVVVALPGPEAARVAAATIGRDVTLTLR